MKTIGISINEAIDWTQDRLQTTRPLAENTLFSLLHTRIVEETEDGFVLLEADDDEIKKHYNNVKSNFHKNYKRFRIRGRLKKLKMNENQRNLPPDDDSTDDSTDDGHESAT
jgi:hypothetical protein